MDKGFLDAYATLLIETCHRRGVHAMGGMAAQIPIKSTRRQRRGLAKVKRTSSARSPTADGTWVAHPGSSPVAKAVFDEHMPQKNQLTKRMRRRARSPRGPAPRPRGTRAPEGLRHNVRVGVRYLEAWLRGGAACRSTT